MCLDYDISHLRQSSHFPLQEWKSAWSYFISVFMIYSYAQSHSQEVKNSNNTINHKTYLHSTKKFLVQQIKQGKVYAWLALMLIDIATKQKEKTMSFILYLVQNPNLSLQYALNTLCKKAREHKELGQLDQSLIQKSIELTAQTLMSAYENRIEQLTD